jgi:hypothetical protein
MLRKTSRPGQLWVYAGKLQDHDWVRLSLQEEVRLPIIGFAPSRYPLRKPQQQRRERYST